MQNVFTATKYTGFDPELTSNMSGSGAFTDRFGVDHGARPVQRSFLIGLNLTF